MAHTLELKGILINIRKLDNQSMDAYLREIKTIANNPALVNSLMSYTDLIHHTLMGLDRDYETLVTTLTHLPL